MKESARRMRPSNKMPLFLKTLRRPLIEREKEHPAPSLRGRGEQTSRSRLLLRTRPVAVVANIAVVPDRRSFAPNLLALEHMHEATHRQRELISSPGQCRVCVCERELLSNVRVCERESFFLTFFFVSALNWLGGLIDCGAPENHFSFFPSLSFSVLQNGLPTSVASLSFFFRRCRDARTDAVRLAEVAAPATQEEEQRLSKRPTATTTTSTTPEPMLGAKS